MLAVEGDSETVGQNSSTETLKHYQAIGLQNPTSTIPKSILPLWPRLYNIGSCCIKAS